MSGGKLSQRAYHALQQRIVSGALPAGRPLSELLLADQIGIGPGPIRAAIQRLLDEGLVEEIPHVGTVVCPPQRREMMEQFELQEALESHAAALAASRIQSDEVDKLQAYCNEILAIGQQLRQSGMTSLDAPLMQRFLAADFGFQRRLVRGCKNQAIIRMLSDCQTLRHSSAYQQRWIGLTVVAKTYRYHKRILRALRKHDADSARKWTVELSRLNRPDTQNSSR